MEKVEGRLNKLLELMENTAESHSSWDWGEHIHTIQHSSDSRSVYTSHTVHNSSDSRSVYTVAVSTLHTVNQSSDKVSVHFTHSTPLL